MHKIHQFQSNMTLPQKHKRVRKESEINLDTDDFANKFGNLPTYKAIDGTGNILSSLIQSLTHSDTFLTHVNGMRNSDDANDKKKAVKIESTIKNIRMYNTTEKPLFLAKDIGILLSTDKHINEIVKKYDSEEKVDAIIIDHNNKAKKVTFLTKYGIHKCIHTSHSPISTLLSRFMTDFIEEALRKDFKKVAKFALKFSDDNPKLVNAGLSDLQQRVSDYQQKLVNEQARTKLLEEQCFAERQKNNELDTENGKLCISQAYNEMHIEQLSKEKKQQHQRISMITDEFADAANNTTENKELRLLKKLTMKPIYIYILHPAYFKKLLDNDKESESSKKVRKNSKVIKTKEVMPNSITFDSDSDDETKAIDSDNPIKKDSEKLLDDKLARNLIDMENYEKNFKTIYNNNDLGDAVESNEYLYFWISFSKPIKKPGKLLLVSTDYVLNKVHYAKVLESLAKNCATIEFKKPRLQIMLFHTSIADIIDVAREELSSLN